MKLINELIIEKNGQMVVFKAGTIVSENLEDVGSQFDISGFKIISSKFEKGSPPERATREYPGSEGEPNKHNIVAEIPITDDIRSRDDVLRILSSFRDYAYDTEFGEIKGFIGENSVINDAYIYRNNDGIFTVRIYATDYGDEDNHNGSDMSPMKITFKK